MKRKAIQLANNTLVVSLPAKWVRQNNIEKGNELEVNAKEKLLVIRKDAGAGFEPKKISIDLSGMSASLVWNYMNAIYRTGVNEIEIFFSEPTIKNIKTGKTKKTMDVMSRITDKMIGMEIIRQSKNSCTLKEVTQLKGDEYHNVLNRIFLSLATMSKDVLVAAENKDTETLENIYLYSEVNINKLSDYCMRILNMQGLKDFKESNANYLITFLLEEIGDVYANIARSVAANPGTTIVPETLSLLEETNALLLLSHKLFLNPKSKYYISFHEERNRVKKNIDSLLNSKKKVNEEILFFLKIILDKLMEVNNANLTAVDRF
jgi:phosphate uptake regulator